MFTVKPEHLDELVLRVLSKAKENLLLPNDKVEKTRFRQIGTNEYMVDVRINATIYTEEIAKSILFRLKAALSPFIRANASYNTPDMKFFRLTVINTLGGEYTVGDFFKTDKEAIESMS